MASISTTPATDPYRLPPPRQSDGLDTQFPLNKDAVQDEVDFLYKQSFGRTQPPAKDVATHAATSSAAQATGEHVKQQATTKWEQLRDLLLQIKKQYPGVYEKLMAPLKQQAELLKRITPEATTLQQEIDAMQQHPHDGLLGWIAYKPIRTVAHLLQDLVNPYHHDANASTPELATVPVEA